MAHGEKEQTPSDEQQSHRAGDIRQLYELSIARLIASSELARGSINRDHYDQKITELEEKSKRGEPLFPQMTKEEFLEKGREAFEEQKNWLAELKDQKR